MSNQFRIAKTTKNALTATDPRDFIFHSSYNTFKIVNEGGNSPTLGISYDQSFSNVAHGMSYTPFTLGFCKFADNYVAPPGTKGRNVQFYFTNLRVNSTNVRFGYFNATDGNYSPSFRYMQTEVPHAGTPSFANPGGRRLVIAKSGYNALTETNPNNIVFDSQFKTMKYALEGNVTVNIPGAANPNAYETTLVTHNLGYYPYFQCFGQDTDFPNNRYIMPINFSDAGYEQHNSVFATKTALIFRAENNSTFGGSSSAYSLKIFYKIYSYDLGF